MRSRLLLFRLGILRSTALTCKVVSVGNITSGGTGKTPVTIYIAKRLKEAGLRVAVVSRGYKGESTGLGVVSNGREILLTPKEAGDEPFLMAEKLEGIPVIVCPDRVRAGRYAISNFSTEVIVLDDGFQHIRLKRDVDIVLEDPKAGPASKLLLPRGLLREPLSGLERADIIMVKGGGATAAKAGVEPVGAYGDRPVVPFSYSPSALIGPGGEREPVSGLKGKKVLLVAGIASPASFIRSIEALGAVIVQKKLYPDHHAYSETDLRAIEELARGTELIVTTEKDMVKLRGFSGGGGLGHFRALEIETVIEDEQGFYSALSERIGLGG